MVPRPPTFRLAILAAALALIPAAASASGDVNVYSYRQPFLVKPLFDAFTAKTGIKVNVVFAKKGLVQRLKSEGRNSPADLVFTVDIARLQEVVDNELGQKVNSDILKNSVPSTFRDPDGYWYALTLRARIIYASKDRVAPGAITTYEQLADPKWRGKICSRKGDHVYNIALLAAMITHHGEAKAEEWIRGVKANLARKPQGNDRAQVRAIMEGVCDLAIGNHYYMALMLTNPKQQKWGQSANIVFPTIGGVGTHMNVSGVMMTKHSPNRDNARKLMEYLVSEEAQGTYANRNYEYPVTDSVKPAELVASWGSYKRDTIKLSDIAGNRPAALKMMNRVAFNQGPATN